MLTLFRPNCSWFRFALNPFLLSKTMNETKYLHNGVWGMWKTQNFYFNFRNLYLQKQTMKNWNRYQHNRYIDFDVSYSCPLPRNRLEGFTTRVHLQHGSAGVRGRSEKLSWSNWQFHQLLLTTSKSFPNCYRKKKILLAQWNLTLNRF